MNTLQRNTFHMITIQMITSHINTFHMLTLQMITSHINTFHMITLQRNTFHVNTYVNTVENIVTDESSISKNVAQWRTPK